MKSVVIYASHAGNTQRIAEAVAATLRRHGSVELMKVDQAPASVPKDTDLLVVGGPTEGHGITPDLVAFFDGLAPGALDGVACVAFDTRLHWPHWLSGSAADRIVERLEASGARIVAQPESFIVSMKPLLEPGEGDRASAWAEALVGRLTPVGSGAGG